MPDYEQAPQQLCQHRLSAGFVRRVVELMHQPPAPVLPEGMEVWPDNDVEEPPAPPEPPVEPEPAPAGITSSNVTPARHGIDARFVVTIQGKPFVKYAGLLEMAHTHGLVTLTANWTYNDAELSLAQAVATFQDGRRFEEAGDATPANCSGKVAVHFRRVALTRAKARVLRDALGIDLVAVEELD